MLPNRRERIYTSRPYDRRLAAPRPTPKGWLRLARPRGLDSASPDDQGQAPPHPTAEGWLHLARRPRAGSASPDVLGLAPPRPTSRASTPCSFTNDEHRVRQDAQVNRSTEDHILHTYGKVPSGYDGTGALSPSRHDIARTML